MRLELNTRPCDPTLAPCSCADTGFPHLHENQIPRYFPNFSLRDSSEFLVSGGLVLFGKSARKKRIPPLGVSVKFWYPLSESPSKKGTPPPRVPEAFQGSRGELHDRGIKGAGELPERDILLCSVSFFVCVKNGYPLLGFP